MSHSNKLATMPREGNTHTHTHTHTHTYIYIYIYIYIYCYVEGNSNIVNVEEIKWLSLDLAYKRTDKYVIAKTLSCLF